MYRYKLVHRLLVMVYHNNHNNKLLLDKYSVIDNVNNGVYIQIPKERFELALYIITLLKLSIITDK